jgi:ring-1,2-phenylacetyl-CoA epoxidase subunit PaaD
MTVDKISVEEIWNALNEVPDPEIPVISIVELGVVRDVVVNDNQIEITITPTYTGCPATNVFEADIIKALGNLGLDQVSLKYKYQPAWTTDWLNDDSREKLRVYGIAPPDGKTSDKRYLLGEDPKVMCVQCRSENTKMLSPFGSTACKSLYQCKDCLETFDYFKCI